MDVVHESYEESLYIDDVRAMQEILSRRPVAAKQRTLVVFAQRITPEAQNALLKLLEEPPKTSRYVLIVPALHILLSTVRSRLHLAAITEEEKLPKEAVTFVRSTTPERLRIIERHHKAKDQTALRTMIYHIGRIATKQPLPRYAHRAIATAVQYHTLSGASPKMLLEEIALTLPIVKECEEVLH
jgi:DNA polymerase III delta prime subunit